MLANTIHLFSYGILFILLNTLLINSYTDLLDYLIVLFIDLYWDPNTSQWYYSIDIE